MHSCARLCTNFHIRSHVLCVQLYMYICCVETSRLINRTARWCTDERAPEGDPDYWHHHRAPISCSSTAALQTTNLQLLACCCWFDYCL